MFIALYWSNKEMFWGKLNVAKSYVNVLFPFPQVKFKKRQVALQLKQCCQGEPPGY